jgi:hypothetical protein
MPVSDQAIAVHAQPGLSRAFDQAGLISSSTMEQCITFLCLLVVR